MVFLVFLTLTKTGLGIPTYCTIAPLKGPTKISKVVSVSLTDLKHLFIKSTRVLRQSNEHVRYPGDGELMWPHFWDLCGEGLCHSSPLTSYCQYNLNPRQWWGGGNLWTPPPPGVFLKWPPNRRADPAETLHSLWSVLCATFGEKIDRVRPGHQAMTSLAEQPPTDFSKKSCFQ